MFGFPASTGDISLDMDVSRGLDGDDRVAVRCYRRVIRDFGEWARRIRSDASGRGLGRRVGNDLEQPRYEPILKCRSVGVRRGYVDGDIVWLTIRQYRGERR